MSVKAKLQKHGFNETLVSIGEDYPYLKYLGERYPRIFLLGHKEISPDGEILLSTIATECLKRGYKPLYIHKIPFDVEKGRVYLIPYIDESWDSFIQTVVLKWAYAFVLVCNTTFKNSFLSKDYFLNMREDKRCF
jgi:hypothetical protein